MRGHVRVTTSCKRVFSGRFRSYANATKYLPRVENTRKATTIAQACSFILISASVMEVRVFVAVVSLVWFEIHKVIGYRSFKKI